MIRNALIVISLGLVGQLAAIGWPLDPVDSVHAIGNNWGEYQNYYGTGPYFHNGIDVFPPPGHVGAPVHAVAHGWVKGWGTIEADYHWRLAISDSPPGYTGRSPGWLYAHIDATRPHKDTGDEVNVGDTIGYLVPWPVTGFDHTHFARISDTGRMWDQFPTTTWWFIENPLLLIQPVWDTAPPVIEDALPGQLFGVCRNNTDSYLDISGLTGDVDIVVRAYDETGFSTGDTTWDKLMPYKYVWSVRGSADSVPPTLGIIFSGLLPDDTDTMLPYVIFKQTSPCVSLGDYDDRDYYVIVTNKLKDDSTISMADTAGCWHTAEFPDGDYWIKVSVSDVVGNVTTDSMHVHTANGNGIAMKNVAGSWHNLNVPTIVRAGTQLSLSLNPAGPGPVRLELFSAAGRLESRVFAGTLGAGKHDLSLTPQIAGVHLLVLTTGQDRMVHKLTVIK
jgi:hypothetical protein